MSPLAPKVIGTFGRYELLERIGMGGMAEVWLAQISGMSGFQKRLVLKTIHPNLAESPEFVRLFIKEASLAARLNHPNIVQIFELGEIEGRHFIAMEYIPGRTLRQARARTRKRGGEPSSRLPPWFLLNVIARGCDGLHYSHELCDLDGTRLGLVHRDISPENIMVSFAGGVKILDFGVAKMSAVEQTHSQALVGKFGYMSPQQAKGERTDLRTDIYALGVILYELLTGEKPFQGANEAVVLHNTVSGKYPPPQEVNPSIPEDLARIIVKAMAYEPEDRYPGASELQSDIVSYIRAAGLSCDQNHLGMYVSALFSESTEIPAHIRNAIAAFESAAGDVARSSIPPIELTPTRASTAGHSVSGRALSVPSVAQSSNPGLGGGSLPTKRQLTGTPRASRPPPPPPSGSRAPASGPATVPSGRHAGAPPPPPVPKAPPLPRSEGLFTASILDVDWPDVDGQEIPSEHGTGAGGAARAASVAGSPAPSAPGNGPSQPGPSAPGDRPSQPGQPTQPERSSQSGQPTQPERSSQSGQPTQPERPLQTAVPAQTGEGTAARGSVTLTPNPFALATRPTFTAMDVFSTRGQAPAPEKTPDVFGAGKDTGAPPSSDPGTVPPADIFASRRPVPERHGGGGVFPPATPAPQPVGSAPSGWGPSRSQVQRWGPYETSETQQTSEKQPQPQPQPPSAAAEHFERGFSLMRGKENERALAEWERAVALDPTNRMYQSNLQRLREKLKSK